MSSAQQQSSRTSEQSETVERRPVRLDDHYDIAPVETVAELPLDRLRAALARREGSKSGIYKITTADRSIYCLKPHRQSLPTAHLDLQAAVLARAQAEPGLPTPKIIATRDGKSYFQSEGINWSLYQFIESDRQFAWFEGDRPADLSYAAGKALFEMHDFLRKVERETKDDAASALSRLSKDGEPDRCIASVLPELGDLFARSVDRFTNESLSNLTSLVEEQKHFLSGTLDLAIDGVSTSATRPSERQLVHGDYHPGNLLCKDGRLLAIIDFEYLHFEDPLYDLGYAASTFCIAGQAQSDDTVVDSEQFKALMSGYGIIHSSRELALRLPSYVKIGLFLQLQWLLDISDRGRLDGGEQASTSEDAKFQRSLDQLIEQQIRSIEIVSRKRSFERLCRDA